MRKKLSKKEQDKVSKIASGRYVKTKREIKEEKKAKRKEKIKKIRESLGKAGDKIDKFGKKLGEVSGEIVEGMDNFNVGLEKGKNDDLYEQMFGNSEMNKQLFGDMGF